MLSYQLFCSVVGAVLVSGGCSGGAESSGSNGTNGLKSLICTSDELSGVNCGTGGLRVDMRLDTNQSAVLDNNEVTSTAYVCSAGGVRSRNWITSALIENQDLGSALAPQIAIDASGNALAVWQQWDGTRFSIWSNRFTPSSDWGTAVLIETNDVGDASSPQIAIDLNGDAMAIWQQTDSLSIVSIYANRFTAITNRWASPQLIESEAQDATSPQIVLDASGNALAAWQQFDGVRTNIWANRFTHAASSWGIALQIEDNSEGDATSPQIAVNSSGNAVAVWEQRDSLGVGSIWANTFAPSIGWARAVPIETDLGSAQTPQVALDASSNAVAVWSQSDGVRLNIWTNRFTTVGNWGNAVLIETNDLGNAISPQIIIDHIGDALAVWGQNDGIRSRIYFNRFPVGSSGWGRAELIDVDASGNFNQANSSTPQIASDASGGAIVIWRHFQDTSAMIVANRFTPNSGWSFPHVLAGSMRDDLALPQIAMNASGNALALWQQSDGTRFNIMHSSFQ